MPSLAMLGPLSGSLLASSKSLEGQSKTALATRKLLGMRLNVREIANARIERVSNNPESTVVTHHKARERDRQRTQCAAVSEEDLFDHKTMTEVRLS